jgi:hypothetical protein
MQLRFPAPLAGLVEFGFETPEPAALRSGLYSIVPAALW